MCSLLTWSAGSPKARVTTPVVICPEASQLQGQTSTPRPEAETKPWATCTAEGALFLAASWESPGTSGAL